MVGPHNEDPNEQEYGPQAIGMYDLYFQNSVQCHVASELWK